MPLAGHVASRLRRCPIPAIDPSPGRDIRQIARRYAEGESCPEIAVDYGVGGDTIRLWLVRHGVTLRSCSEAARLREARARAQRRPKTYDLDMEGVVARYVKAGMSYAAIGVLYGVSGSTIRRRLIAAGVPLRGLAGAARVRASPPAVSGPLPPVRPVVPAHALADPGTPPDPVGRLAAAIEESLGQIDPTALAAARSRSSRGRVR